MSAPQNCLRIAPEVAKALGKTPEQLAALTLGEFQILAYYYGYDVRVGGFDVKSATDGHLTVRMAAEGRPIVNVGG